MTAADLISDVYISNSEKGKIITLLKLPSQYVKWPLKTC